MAGRKKLLDWIKNGDPDIVPVMFGSHKDIIASYYKVKPEELTMKQVEEEAKKIGIEVTNSLGSMTLFDVLPYCPDMRMETREEKLDNGTVRTFRTLYTPKGEMNDVREKPPTWESAPKECFVKTEADLPAFEYFVKSTVRTAVEDPHFKQELLKKGRENKGLMSGDVVTVWGTWTPIFELTCTNFVMADAAIFLLYDHTSLFEELMELIWEKDKAVMLAVGDELDADIFMTAINGLEWYSPSLYEKYMIPQGRCLFRWGHDRGRMSWLHTCGKMNGLIKNGTYDRLRPTVLESLSSLPLGDIDDMKEARSRLGSSIVTRGGMNVEVIFSGTVEEVRKQTHRILDGTRGYRHMIGDTNGHFYGDPPENIKAVIDTVRERGQAFS